LVPCLLLAACASAPPAPVRQSAESCLLAIHVHAEGRPDIPGGDADKVWFARLDGDAPPGPLLVSNATHAGTVCLANAAPGRYVAVACAHRLDGRDQITHFPAELVQATETTVEPGGYAWMGSYRVERTSALHPDEAQQRYAPMIEPDWDRANLAQRLFERKYYRLGRNGHRMGDVRRKERAREEFGAAWVASP
jgi:hypothetical protein